MKKLKDILPEIYEKMGIGKESELYLAHIINVFKEVGNLGYKEIEVNKNEMESIVVYLSYYKDSLEIVTKGKADMLMGVKLYLTK